MKQLSKIPESLIWMVFSVTAGFGYAFSVFDYIGGNAKLSAADVVIPTLMWLLLAAVSALCINFVKKTQCFTKFTKFEKYFLEGSILFFLLIGGWLFRFSEPFHGIWPANMDNEFFHYAQVSTQSEIYNNPHPASRLYVGFLHVVFLLLGNIYKAGALTQYVLLLIGVFLWYLAVRKLFGQVTALCFMAGTMLLPDSIIASMQYNPMMLLFSIYGVLMWCVASYFKSHGNGVAAFTWELLIGIGIGITILLDISGFIFVAVGLCAVWYRYKDETTGCRILHIIYSLLGTVAGIVLFHGIQIYLYKVDFHTVEGLYAYGNLMPQMPELTQLKDFIFELGTHPIFIISIVTIVTYWFLKSRAICAWIMAAVLFLLGLKVFGLDIYMQHDFLSYVGLLMLFGITLREATSIKNEKEQMQEIVKVVSTEPSVVTVVHFEEESAVVVPEKQEEKPVIFIPKSMEIPKRISKPKVEFTIDVAEENMHYDVKIDDDEDFDIK